MTPSRPPLGPPSSEAELLQRARALAGSRLGDVARQLGMDTPADLRRAKGWPGLVVERALGATAGPRARPDFEALGVELKTLPVDARGRPCESTFVCSIPLLALPDLEWEQSPVWHKLRRVLWVPVEGERSVPPGLRRIGEPLLWSPGARDEADLRCDWQELAGIIGRGDVETLTARVGQWLQVRPKAASSRSRRRGVDRDGSTTEVVPRGFYLRATFTHRLLGSHYVVPD